MLVRSSICIILILCNTCRVRDESSRIKDVTPSATGDSGGLELQIDLKALSSAKISVIPSAGKLDLWSMLYDDAVTSKIQARIGALKIDQANHVSISDHGNSIQTAKASLASKSVMLSGISGRPAEKLLSVREKNGNTVVFSRDLSTDFFSDCPSEFLTPNGTFFTHFRKSESIPPITIEGDLAPSITKVIYRPKGITWLLSCERVIGWSDIPESKLMLKVSFEVKLESDKIIFPGVASDPKYPALKVGSIKTEADGHGTRYFRDYASMEPESTFIQRWNPLRNRIVIDDMNDSFGKPLSQFKQGPWVQEALKIATADLRIKFPELGKKIALTSEQPRLQPDIAFAMGDAMGNAGIALMLLDDKNGELRQARIGLGEESNLNGRVKMIDGFHKLGLIEDPKRSFKDSYLFTVLHELGHTLGLRHNFAGYGMNKNWGNDLQAVMSYAMIGFPIEFVSDKIEWKPHDILSLKILYADTPGAGSQNRGAWIQEILRFPLSQDEFFNENPFGEFPEHLKAAIRFLENTNHPKVVKFRDNTPDWKSRVRTVYKEAYDVDLE